MERACMCTPQITLKIWAGLHAACYIIHTCTHIYKGCLADDEAGCCLLRADGQLLLYVAAAPVVDAVHYGLMAMAKEPLFCRAAAPACCCWGCSKGFFRTCSAVGRERGSCDIRRLIKDCSFTDTWGIIMSWPWRMAWKRSPLAGRPVPVASSYSVAPRANMSALSSPTSAYRPLSSSGAKYLASPSTTRPEPSFAVARPKSPSL
mmetsp:Transcript_6240/g.16562  ORF Transcript_6240/g.16562 Transcript_6240/m.16562 type:complete len:205 (-) Transcript_6240:1681-2295(-)